jgi:ribosomal protein RSM22 (predicted rRNA methylase)
MHLPSHLKNAIELLLEKFPADILSKASKELSHRYREERGKPINFMNSEAHRLAYLLARMPATFAAVSNVFDKFNRHVPNIQLSSLLDLGAGPGTASWAAVEQFKELRLITLLEQDAKLIELGKNLIKQANQPILKQAVWQQKNLLSDSTFDTHDLLVISYALGELPESELLPFLNRCWNSTRKALVIVEPGTMHGFSLIKKARQELIQKEAYIAAPCPHTFACPMPSNDWCHFSVRLERSSQHRLAKGGSLGYEDEKFSYIIATKEAPWPATERILRHPLKRPGHSCFELCTIEGIQKKTISKRDPELYRAAKKLEWGDSYP